MDFLSNIRKTFRENPRMWIAVLAAVVVGGLMVWVVYGQSSIQFSQFFAATPFNQCPYADRNKTECGCNVTQQGEPKSNAVEIPHVCTKAFQDGDTDYSDQQWFAWDQQYQHPYHACQGGSPYLTQRLKADGTAFGTPLGCVEKPPDCPEGYYAFDTGGQKYCYQGSPGGGGGGGATPSPTITPTVTPTPTISTAAVICAPQVQTIAQGQTASLQATGGNGTFQWNVTGGGVVESGGNESISVSYQIAGTKSVRVNSGTASAACTVVVQAPSTATPTPGSTITVQKTVRDLTGGMVDPVENLTVTPGRTIQFVITVTSVSSVPFNNIYIKDIIPPGMSYQSATTYINGQPISVDTIATSGLALGTLAPGEQFTAQWSAVSNNAGQLVTGIQESRPLVTVTADGIAPVSDDVTLEIQGTGTGTAFTPTPTGVGGVQTGPGDAVLIAFMTAAAVTLLYTAYTRSPGFTRKEAEKISRDHDPLDFRS